MALNADRRELLLKNQLLSTKNFLNYTGLTYEDIVKKINERLSSDSRFDNFRESAVAKIILEIFAGTTDLINYYIERRAEEVYMDTARHMSSVILLSRNLGYDIKRLVPAEAQLAITIKGNIDPNVLSFSSADVSAGNVKIQIPQYTNFSVDNKNFLLKKRFSYTLLPSDLNQGSSYEKKIVVNEVETNDEDDNITIIQGEYKIAKIQNLGNEQANQIFQKYTITDKSFSNKYGEKDYVDGAVTIVGIGETQAEAFSENNVYNIQRRSLINPSGIDTFDFTASGNTPQKIVLIRTSTTEGVDLLFGDDKYAAIGLDSNVDNNIFVQYLSTLGSKANKSGLVGNSVEILDFVDTLDIDVEFSLDSNIIGGADTDSIDEIRINSPAIYNSLERLVTKNDYVNYLKTLSTPFPIQNAIVWGEQEELLNLGLFDNSSDQISIRKMFNVVLFSVIGSMYNIGLSLNSFSTKSNLDSVTLDVDFDKDSITAQNYFNVFVNNNAIQQIKRINTPGMKYAIIYGAEIVGSDATSQATLLNNQTLSFQYFFTSATSNTSIGTSGVSLSTSGFTTYNQIADHIEEQIRSLSISGNTSAFGRVEVTYDDTNIRYIIKSSYDDMYSIRAFTETPASQIMFINSAENNFEYVVGTTNLISEGLKNITTTLQDRSPVTVKPVYISPIIQDFDLTGKIFVRRLVNKDDLLRRIKNKIYLWLDEQADFNKNLYISNVTELIEAFPDVIYANVELTPFDPITTNTSGLPYTKNLSAAPEISAWSPSGLHSVVREQIDSYISSNLNTSATHPYESSDRVKKIWNDFLQRFDTVLTKSLVWTNKINTRSFFNVLVKNIYDNVSVYSRILSDGSIEYFRDSVDFLNLISKIYKDFLYMIRFNMLDRSGNIAPEIRQTVDSDNIVISEERINGGFSLGNEIVRITVKPTIEYL